MQTLKEYMQSNTFADKLQEIYEQIDELDVTAHVKNKMYDLISSNEFEIAEYQHQSLVSDAEDYAYEKHKEEKYFKDDN